MLKAVTAPLGASTSPRVADADESGQAGPTWGAVTTTLPRPSSLADGDALRRALLGAWCVLAYRHLDQDALVVRAVTPSTPGAPGTDALLDIALDGDDPALNVTAAVLRAEGATRSAATERPPLAFSFFTGDQVPLFPPSREAVPGAPLHLSCAAEEGRVRCSLAFDLESTSPVAATRMLGELAVVFEAIITRPACPLRTLPLMTPDESAALATSLRGPGRALAEIPSFRAIERHADLRPDSIAIELGATSLTYAALNERANQLAHWLRARGAGPGARVAVSMEPHLDFVVAMLAIFKSGATHVPLDPAYPPDRLSVILADVQPVVTLTTASLVDKLAPLTSSLHATEELASELARMPSDNPSVAIVPSSVAYIVYTSGTTGKPKGVMVTHANLAHYIDVAAATYGYGPRDVIPAMARFSFSITFFELLSPLAAGGRLVLLERAHVLDLPRMCETLTRITCIHCSPSLWRKLIQHIDERRLPTETFDDLRHVSSGGDMVPPDVLASLKRLFRRADVFVIYGSSEISCMGCTFPVPRDRALTSTRVGKPFPNMTLRLLDAAGQMVPPGVIGEVCFGGEGLAAGYLEAPALTAEKFREHEGERLYHMGDLGRLDEEGNLELVGRRDFQIKLRGIRIEPADIEANLRALPEVKDVIVAAPTMADGEKRLVAYVVADPQRPPTARAMRAFLKERLPDYMVPAAFVVLDALPVNVNNKVDRLKLQRLDLMLPTGTSDEAKRGPRNERERQLLALWEKALGVQGLGVDDDFFDVGGDSLRSLALMTALDRELGVALPVSTLLSAPTVAQLAEVLAQESEPAPSSVGAEAEKPVLVCLRKGRGDRPAVFFIHDGDGESLPYRNLALRLHPGHTVWGVHPKSRRHHPILHTRIAEVVSFYAARIRAVQPEGPYLLGGLCIGGFLAFEVGRLLRDQGFEVAPIALIDVGHVTAPRRSLASKRVGRLSRDLAELADHPWAPRLLASAKLVAKRARGMIGYEVTSRSQRKKTELTLRAFRACLDRGLPLPAFLRDISVDAALRFAEREYEVPGVYAGAALLFRATRRDPALDGIVDDTPYIEVFADEALGWKGKAAELEVHDVPAGHSSCLQEPAVALIAETFQRHIDLTLARASQRGSRDGARGASERTT